MGEHTDEVTVSAATLRQVADDVRQNRDSLLEQAMFIQNIDKATEKTATASLEMAAIARERMELEREARREAADQAREAAKADAEAKAKLFHWWSENWRYVVLLLVIIFYPQLLGQMQQFGLLPNFQTQAAAQPLPVPMVEP